MIVDMAVSPEKVTLLTDLAETFNASGAKVGDRCAAVRVARKSSGAAATLLEQGWPNPETNGPARVIWSPAASGWAAIVKPARVRKIGDDHRQARPALLNRKISVAIIAQWSNFPYGLAANRFVDNCQPHRRFVCMDQVPSSKTSAAAAHTLWLQFAGSLTLPS
jgi:hypothetical protein